MKILFRKGQTSVSMKKSWIEIVLKTGGVAVFAVLLGALKQPAPVSGQTSNSQPPNISAVQPSDPYDYNGGTSSNDNNYYQNPYSDSQNQSGQPNFAVPRRSRTRAS